MNQRLWNSSLNIIFSVALLVLAAVFVSGAAGVARIQEYGDIGKTEARQTSEMVLQHSQLLDEYYLPERDEI